MHSPSEKGAKIKKIGRRSGFYPSMDALSSFTKKYSRCPPHQTGLAKHCSVGIGRILNTWYTWSKWDKKIQGKNKEEIPARLNCDKKQRSCAWTSWASHRPAFPRTASRNWNCKHCDCKVVTMALCKRHVKLTDSDRIFDTETIYASTIGLYIWLKNGSRGPDKDPFKSWACFNPNFYIWQGWVHEGSKIQSRTEKSAKVEATHPRV